MPDDEPISLPAGQACDDPQVRDSAAAKVEPNGGEASALAVPAGGLRSLWRRFHAWLYRPAKGWSGPPPPPPPPLASEPPEVERFTGPGPWLLLPPLLLASLWLPALLAGYGRNLARQDEAALRTLEAEMRADYADPDPEATAQALADLIRDWQTKADFGPEWKSLSLLTSARVQRSADGSEWIAVYDGLDIDEVSGYVNQTLREDPVMDAKLKDLFGSNGKYLVKKDDDDATTVKVPTIEGDAPQEAHFFDARYPGRSAATYQPGSIYYETARVLAAHEGSLLDALASGASTALPTRSHYAVLMRDSNWVLPDPYLVMKLLGYRLHEAAFRGDWTAFLATTDLVYGITDLISPTYWGLPDTRLAEVVGQHGFTMPEAVLRELRARVLARQLRAYDVEREMRQWDVKVRRSTLNAALQQRGTFFFLWDSQPTVPVYLQEYAMHYPWLRRDFGQVTAAVKADLRAALAQPGIQGPTGSDGHGHGMVYLWDSLVVVTDDTLVSTVERFDCRRQNDRALLLAAIDALLLKRDTGTWPTTVDELGEPDLRADPCANPSAPINLRIDATGALRLWTVGRNGLDGGGIFPWEILPSRQDDSIIRLLSQDDAPAGEGAP